MLRHLPNFLTCCNLICGCLGLISLWENPNIPTAYFVWIAAAFDFADGLVARALKTTSSIGKELDSLADMVSFGVLPALLMYTLIDFESPLPYLPYAGLLLVVASAIRLAVFNIDKTQSDSFKGLPTPANAIFITGIPFLQAPFFDFIFNPLALIFIAILFSLLMVLRFELFGLKFKQFGWKGNELKITFLALSVLLIVFFQYAAVPLIILLYLGLSLGVRVISK
jgi:CDP-diacylglycerol--serine O-phosphatidyltransferase